MKQTILLFGGISIAVLLLIQLSKYSLLYQKASTDTYIAVFGLGFVFLGFSLSRLSQKKSPPTAFTKNEISPPTQTIISEPSIDQKQLEATGLSKREYEILLLIEKGYSNAEIGTELFISENTVKTHVSKILMKLNAKRRTQAVQIGRELNIL